ncbi:MAG TPA: hypothetical protein VHE13_12410 [Opitutus sp.]|nr:hypothetical protein [Opitutus sp.]
MFRGTTNADVPGGWLRRLVAGASVALLLLLAVAAASPAIHQWLHGDSAPEAGDSCAVVLFATGVTVAAAAIAVVLAGAAWRVERVREAAEIFVAAPRYLRLPERGPPLS